MNLKSAVQWRKSFYKEQFYKYKGSLINFLDTSPKEEVKSVSLIVVGRNDNYGGDFSKRLKATLDWNLKYLTEPELIYVEWNPVHGRPSDCLWISERYQNCRCYIVPEEIHKSVARYPDKMKVMEYFGKNLGIRKSLSEWIILANADVIIGPGMFKNMKYLNRDTIYGGNYVNIKWDGEAISEQHFRDRRIVKTFFAGQSGFNSTVGNFILTNKKNWMLATGYDETLNGSRVGVDSNGYYQLKNLGLKSRVIGNHFHLDHAGSIISSSDNVNHGDRSALADDKNIPYKNDSSWGLINYPLKQISERIWELQSK